MASSNAEERASTMGWNGFAARSVPTAPRRWSAGSFERCSKMESKTTSPSWPHADPRPTPRLEPIRSDGWVRGSSEGADLPDVEGLDLAETQPNSPGQIWAPARL